MARTIAQVETETARWMKEQKDVTVRQSAGAIPSGRGLPQSKTPPSKFPASFLPDDCEI
jgi:hypothetical protein